ncbi:MAG: PorP/SprF family type IX secretion system membrane protein [Roseivirga sp.]|nr:PorP/SprF family type IX secretion system membrane protein [Roseivirga sp.]
MRILNISILGLLLTLSAEAQFFQFSQRHFTPQRVNPALVGSRDYFHVMANFRNQSTAGDFSLLSSALDLAYPVSWGGQRRGGVGLFLLDDRSGSGGIYNIQEAGLSTAVSIPTAESSSFNLGLSLGYQRRSFDFNGLSTGSQFVPDRGFDQGLNSGENFGDPGSSFLRWNAGLYWQKALTERVDRSYIGLSVYDINRADESVFDQEATLPVSFIAEGGTMINRTPKSIIWAEAFAYGSGNNYAFQAGLVMDRELQTDQYLKFRARYSTENFVILGATLEKGQFAVGATYDIGIGKSSVSNQSAFEVGVQWKMFVKPKGKKKRKKGTGEPTNRTRPKREQPVDSLSQKVTPEVDIEPEETAKSDSTAQVKGPGETEFVIGQPRSRKRIVEEFEVRLPFRFNSYEISEEFAEFLDQVVTRLKESPEQTAEVTGHTDNVGSEEVNQRISLARAQAVADYLISKGILASRITVSGKGESLPISTNDTPAGRALNRRVEITILK